MENIVNKEDFEFEIDRINMSSDYRRRLEAYDIFQCKLLNEILTKLDQLAKPLDTIKKEQGVTKWGPKI